MQLDRCVIQRGGGGTTRELYNLFHALRINGGYIAGGYARWAVSPFLKPALPTDIDCFFTNPWGWERCFYSLKRTGWQDRLRSRIALSLSHPDMPLPIQLVYWTGSPDVVVEGFDIGICQAALINGEGFVSHDFFAEEEARVIRIKKPHSLLLTTQRIVKYIQRGYEMPKEEWDVLFRQFRVQPLNSPVSPEIRDYIESLEQGRQRDPLINAFIGRRTTNDETGRQQQV